MGISPMVIAMIVVTVESAAPELLVSVNAIWEGAAGLAVGNVIVSNIANILPVLGAAFLPVHEQILSFDIWVILASSVLLLPDLTFGWKIDRMSGMVIASAYGSYVWIQTVGVPQVIG
jgi:cation:H+ antiporter